MKKRLDANAETIREAEKIWKRWQNEQFDIDHEKSDKEYGSWTFMDFKPGDDGTDSWELVREKRLPLAIFFGNAISGYRSYRGTKRWPTTADILCLAYQEVRLRGCVIAGSATKQAIQDREHRIVTMDAELQATKRKLEEMTDKYDRASKLNWSNEARLGEIQEKLDTCRDQLEQNKHKDNSHENSLQGDVEQQ